MYGETREERVVPMKRFLVEVVEAYAKEHDIQTELISGDWIIRLTKDGEQRYIFGLDFGLNTSVAKLLARDKSATSDVLAHADVPHIEHRLFLRPGSPGANPNGNWNSLRECFAEFNNDVVCKPNDGSSGQNVVRAQTQAEFEATIQELFGLHRAIAVSPFVPIESEYRVCVLDDEVLLSYEKVKDGNEPLKFNLHAGAQARDITDTDLANRVHERALQAARALGIRLANIDIARVGDELFVLEVNASSMFEHYALQGKEEERKARDVYYKVLDKLFTRLA